MHTSEMSDYGWLSKCSLAQKSTEQNKIHGVSDSSMIELRAVIASQTLKRQQKSQTMNVDDNEEQSIRARRIENVRTLPSKRNRNRNVEKRMEKDEEWLEEERSKKSMKYVKAKLEEKSRIYDKLMNGEGGVDINDNVNDNDGTKGHRAGAKKEYMVDFQRKRDYMEEKNDSATDEGYCDDNRKRKRVPIEDEFGRTKYVLEDSTEYRCYLAEEARRLRMEEMRNMPGFAQNVDGSGYLNEGRPLWRSPHTKAGAVAHHRYWIDKGNIGNNSYSMPHQHDTIRSSFRPMGDLEKEKVKQINEETERMHFMRQINQAGNLPHRVPDSSNTKPLSRREKKAARLKVIQQKQEARQARNFKCSK